MNEYYKIILTSSLTILTGAVTLVLGQIAIKLLIDPIQEFKRIVSEISHALIEYANVFGNPGVCGADIERKVSEEIRKLSARLSAQMYLIPAYAVVSKVFRLPSKAKVDEASRNLIGLSNGFNNIPNQGIHNSYKAQQIRDALCIYVPESERLNPEGEKCW